jgi:membrane-associated protease RseP (regulator of RpoE activity)
MRTHIRPQATILTLCLALATAAAFAVDGPAVPPAAPAPPAPADSATLATPADTDESAMRDRMDEARRRADEDRRHEDVLRAQMDAARRRLEVAAQQLAALSAQVNGPMMQRVEAMAGPTRVLVGIQLDDSSGSTGARVREVSPGGPAERAGVRVGDLIVAVNGTDVRGPEPVGHVVRLLRDVKPGDKVDLKVLRDGTTRDLTATARPDGDEFFVAREFPAMPAMPAMPAIPDMPRVKALAGWDGPMIISGPIADMELARLTPGLGRYFGTDTGVLVVRAPAKGGLGLQDGDVILSIDGRKPIDSSHAIRIFGSYDPGEKFTLDVLRLHRRISVVATVPAEPPMARSGGLNRKDALLEPGVVLTLHGNRRML